MGKVFASIDEDLVAWIAEQPMFFVGSAPLDPAGHVNVSPKGPIGSFRVTGPLQVAYLDYVGSGAETSAHLQENGRIVVMFCSFEHRPRIVRLHGTGRVLWAEDPGFDEALARWGFAEPAEPAMRRAIIVIDVERVSDSCGFGVPKMAMTELRTDAETWARGKIRRDGEEALTAYKTEHNTASLDGLPAWPG